MGRSTMCTGAAHELIVAADLIRRGFDVYRALSPHSSCDLIISKDGGDLQRIEVRTASTYRKRDGGESLSFPRSGKYDILAVVVATDRRIIYSPDFPPG